MKSITGMGGMGNARELAEMLRQMGRGRDTVLAHITPEEAQMLLDQGGAGTINPATGLPEFQDADIQGEENFYGEPMYNYDVEAQQGGFYGETPTAYIWGSSPESTTVGLLPNGSRMTPAFSTTTEGQGVTYEPVPLRSLDVEAQLGGFYGGRAPTPAEYDLVYPAAAPQEPGMAQQLESRLGSISDIARKYPRLAQLAGYSTQGLVGMLQAARARRQGREEAARLSELGRPMREQAESLRTQALSGALTPQQAAQQEAQRARLRQQAAGRGATTGTQSAMIENQLARSRSELSQTNLNNALRMLNLANAYDEAAIRAKLASDREADDLLAQIFGNIGSQLAGTGPAQRPQRQAPQPVQEITRRPEVPRGE